MSIHYEKLVTKLRELFELDKADLDFGIYRIIAQRQDEIQQFLDHDLKQSVQAVLKDGDGSQRESLQRELDAAIKSMQDLGMEPSSSPKVKELEEKVAAFTGSDYQEIQTYEHLYTFFSRYYEEGDFISQRRVSKDARYAIPYNGEEVKLHWANADQYYIKSSENFRDYRFKLDDGRFVNFKLLDAESSRDNTKGDKRFFMLSDEPVTELDNGELQIGFHYQGLAANQKKVTAADGKEKMANQKVFNELTAKTIQQQLPVSWQSAVFADAPTKANTKRTLLEKHINDYTAKNSFDYFIHKDLGGFLRRELDFYIKNEVLELDDVVQADEAKLAERLKQIKAIRKVADLVITFLAQIENFQRKLWLKQKFVVKSDYCFTLDRLPESLYSVIADNEAQRKEWVSLGFIEDDIEITTDSLKTNPFLIVDTQHFDLGFKYDCLGAIEDIDEQCDGLLIHGDNFQALNLLHYKFQEKIQCIYVDPPYNKDGDHFVYKDSYRHSTWLSMILDRLEAGRKFLRQDGYLAVSIDDIEFARIQIVLDQTYGAENRVANLVWDRNRKNDAKLFSVGHEYMVCYANNKSLLTQKKTKLRELKAGVGEAEKKYRALYRRHKSINDNFKDDWKFYIHSLKDPEVKSILKKFPKLSEKGPYRDDGNINWPGGGGPRYEVLHPITNKAVKIPKSGWRYSDPATLWDKYNAGYLSFGRDESTVPGVVYYLFESNSQVMGSSFWSYAQTASDDFSAIMGEGVFENPKNYKDIGRISSYLSSKNSIILDYFGGSGTTAHAVISLNRGDNGNRKYVLVEQGEYFDKVLKPRVKKIVFSESWAEGKPIVNKDNSFSGISHCLKKLVLESYEDTQNNLVLNRTGQQQALLESGAELKQDYTLNYMLDIESKGSLLNIEAFEQPFSYQMHIATDSAGETQLQNIDLIETFNYLIGLTVHTLQKTTVKIEFEQDNDGIWQPVNRSAHCQEGEENSYTFVVINGELPNGDSALVIWRVLNDFANPQSKLMHNMAADAFVMDRLRVNTKDKELDAIFVNGDNTLPNIRSGDEHWKVRLIEEEFQRLMFLEQ